MESKEKEKKEMIVRAAQRNPTEVAIICQPYSSNSTMRPADGVMRNFSTEGSYIETSCQFKSGTILIVRMVGCPPLPADQNDDWKPRSICLAEVKWRQELVDEDSRRYGMGLKYLE